jgi:hypothetical protein
MMPIWEPMDRKAHCDELLGGHWLPAWSDEDEAYPAEDVEELQALLAQLVQSLSD